MKRQVRGFADIERIRAPWTGAGVRRPPPPALHLQVHDLVIRREQAVAHLHQRLERDVGRLHGDHRLFERDIRGAAYYYYR